MVLALGDILEKDYDKEKLLSILNKFKCSKDTDVENFLKNKAVAYELKNKAKTFFIFNEEIGEIEAYFSLALNVFEYHQNTTKACKKDTSLGHKKKDAAYLIGQIGKSDTCTQKHILGDLLEQVYMKIEIARKSVGGRLIYLECKQNQKVKELYMSYGFLEAGVSPESELLQMYKIL